MDKKQQVLLPVISSPNAIYNTVWYGLLFLAADKRQLHADFSKLTSKFQDVYVQFGRVTFWVRVKGYCYAITVLN